MKSKYITLVMALAITGLAHAAVSPEEAKQLGSILTPWGAIKAGNKEGSIPAYDGGLPTTTAPPGFVKDSGHWADPFGNEKPLYSITAKNMAEYSDKLSEVAKELLKRYPTTFRLDVYPTHRVVNYSQSVIDNTLKNATRCKSIEDGVAVSGCFGGLPFPIPKTGNEVMWNVELAPKRTYFSENEQVYVDSSGTPITSVRQETFVTYPYFDPKETLESFEEKGGKLSIFSVIQKYPPRIAGDGTLAMFFTNPVKHPNKGWNYQQGNRRVRVIPDAQYDYPVLPSGGAMFIDEGGLFQGKMDRFDFKLLGTKEMIIPYSTYRAVQASKEVNSAAGGGHHPNPDILRWELHRVRVVEATLKPGMRHAYAKRRFYIDEDHPSAGMADAWDHAGKLYKGSMGLTFWMYDKQAAWFNSNLVIDLATGVQYWSVQFDSTMRGVKLLDQEPPPEFNTPEGLARRSAR